jgi:hypothetical protein
MAAQIARTMVHTVFLSFVVLTQTTDFLPFAGNFSPCGAKNYLQKKKSTMLPQATAAFAYALLRCFASRAKKKNNKEAKRRSAEG